MSPTLLKIYAFSQAKDLLGFSEKTVPANPAMTPRELIENLQPHFTTRNRSFRIALDEEYASWDQPLENARVLAIIPPVSGG